MENHSITTIIVIICFTDPHFTEQERKWIERLQFFIGLYIKMFLVTAIVYIISPNIFAVLHLAMGNQNTTLLPETAKIEWKPFDDTLETPIYRSPFFQFSVHGPKGDLLGIHNLHLPESHNSDIPQCALW